MSNKEFRFELDEGGVRALLRSQEIQDACFDMANQRARALGRGYKAKRRFYPERTGAVIHANTKRAQKQNFKNNTLLKAIG